jgi:hypothetical protein
LCAAFFKATRPGSPYTSTVLSTLRPPLSRLSRFSRIFSRRKPGLSSLTSHIFYKRNSSRPCHFRTLQAAEKLWSGCSPGLTVTGISPPTYVPTPLLCTGVPCSHQRCPDFLLRSTNYDHVCGFLSKKAAGSCSKPPILTGNPGYVGRKRWAKPFRSLYARGQNQSQNSWSSTRIGGISPRRINGDKSPMPGTAELPAGYSR